MKEYTDIEENAESLAAYENGEVFTVITEAEEKVTQIEEAAKEQLSSFGIPIDSPFFITLFTLGSLAIVAVIVGFGLTVKINMDKKKAKKTKPPQPLPPPPATRNQGPNDQHAIRVVDEYDDYAPQHRPSGRERGHFQSKLGERNLGGQQSRGYGSRPTSPSKFLYYRLR